MDAAKYSDDKNLKIKRIFEMIPSNLENKKKIPPYTIRRNFKKKGFTVWKSLCLQ